MIPNSLIKYFYITINIIKHITDNGNVWLLITSKTKINVIKLPGFKRTTPPLPPPPTHTHTCDVSLRNGIDELIEFSSSSFLSYTLYAFERC